MTTRKRMKAVGGLVTVAFLSASLVRADLVNYQMVTVGDAGNAADPGTGGIYGAVAYEYRIGKYEVTNRQYAAFLNSVASTDTYNLYRSQMGTSFHGGITQLGTSGTFVYVVKESMEDKPVNYVSWFSAARMANWLQNGGAANSATETGAYTLEGATYGLPVARNPDAHFYIPTDDEWYKAAYYKGGGVESGYYSYATQSDAAPFAVGATDTGVGAVGDLNPVISGNSANYNLGASWNGHYNVTSVGTNGGPSVYGTFDMTGNVREWTDLDGKSIDYARGVVGGAYYFTALQVSSSHIESYSTPGSVDDITGFRLAGSVDSPPVPEIDPAGMGSVVALVTGALGLLERRRKVC